MARLGTYTTYDSPTEKQDLAFDWLVKKFDKIEGTVRKLSNPHDFGNYPSFEIDYPEHLEDIDLEDEDDDLDLQCEKDKWHDQADKIYREYGEEFSEYL